jgi:hypothetical protein
MNSLTCIGVTFCAALFLMSSGASAAGHPDFSGTWTLDPAKSNFGFAPVPKKLEYRIVHRDPDLKFTIVMSTVSGEAPQEIVCSTDGKQSITHNEAGEMRTMGLWEGGVLLITSRQDAGGNEVRTEERWSLSPDRKELKIENSFSSPGGQENVTLVLRPTRSEPGRAHLE